MVKVLEPVNTFQGTTEVKLEKDTNIPQTVTPTIQQEPTLPFVKPPAFTRPERFYKPGEIPAVSSPTTKSTNDIDSLLEQGRKLIATKTVAKPKQEVDSSVIAKSIVTESVKAFTRNFLKSTVAKPTSMLSAVIDIKQQMAYYIATGVSPELKQHELEQRIAARNEKLKQTIDKSGLLGDIIALSTNWWENNLDIAITNYRKTKLTLTQLKDKLWSDVLQKVGIPSNTISDIRKQSYKTWDIVNELVKEADKFAQQVYVEMGPYAFDKTVQPKGLLSPSGVAEPTSDIYNPESKLNIILPIAGGIGQVVGQYCVGGALARKTGLMGAGLAEMGVVAGTDLYNMARQNGASVDEALTLSSLSALQETATELLPFGTYLKSNKSWLKKVLSIVWSDLPGEMISTAIDNAVDKLDKGEPINPLTDQLETIIITVLSDLLLGASNVKPEEVKQTLVEHNVPEPIAKEVADNITSPQAKNLASQLDSSFEKAVNNLVNTIVETHGDEIMSSAKEKASKIISEVSQNLDLKDKVDSGLIQPAQTLTPIITPPPEITPAPITPPETVYKPETTPTPISKPIVAEVIEKEVKQPALPEQKGVYEVSSKGDKRFSALYATLKDGRTIEQAWAEAKGYKTAKEAKGKPALKENFDYEKEYTDLWRQWAKENPKLIQELAEISKTKKLVDSFATTQNNQAKALETVISELYKKPTPTPTSKIVSKPPRMPQETRKMPESSKIAPPPPTPTSEGKFSSISEKTEKTVSKKPIIPTQKAYKKYGFVSPKDIVSSYAFSIPVEYMANTDLLEDYNEKTFPVRWLLDEGYKTAITTRKPIGEVGDLFRIANTNGLYKIVEVNKIGLETNPEIWARKEGYNKDILNKIKLPVGAYQTTFMNVSSEEKGYVRKGDLAMNTDAFNNALIYYMDVEGMTEREAEDTIWENKRYFKEKAIEDMDFGYNLDFAKEKQLNEWLDKRIDRINANTAYTIKLQERINEFKSFINNLFAETPEETKLDISTVSPTEEELIKQSYDNVVSNVENGETYIYYKGKKYTKKQFDLLFDEEISDLSEEVAKEKWAKEIGLAPEEIVLEEAVSESELSELDEQAAIQEDIRIKTPPPDLTGTELEKYGVSQEDMETLVSAWLDLDSVNTIIHDKWIKLSQSDGVYFELGKFTKFSMYDAIKLMKEEVYNRLEHTPELNQEISAINKEIQDYKKLGSVSTTQDIKQNKCLGAIIKIFNLAAGDKAKSFEFGRVWDWFQNPTFRGIYDKGVLKARGLFNTFNGFEIWLKTDKAYEKYVNQNSHKLNDSLNNTNPNIFIDDIGIHINTNKINPETAYYELFDTLFKASRFAEAVNGFEYDSEGNNWIMRDDIQADIIGWKHGLDGYNKYFQDKYKQSIPDEKKYKKILVASTEIQNALNQWEIPITKINTAEKINTELDQALETVGILPQKQLPPIEKEIKLLAEPNRSKFTEYLRNQASAEERLNYFAYVANLAQNLASVKEPYTSEHLNKLNALVNTLYYSGIATNAEIQLLTNNISNGNLGSLTPLLNIIAVRNQAAYNFERLTGVKLSPNKTFNWVNWQEKLGYVLDTGEKFDLARNINDITSWAFAQKQAYIDAVASRIEKINNWKKVMQNYAKSVNADYRTLMIQITQDYANGQQNKWAGTIVGKLMDEYSTYNDKYYWNIKKVAELTESGALKDLEYRKNHITHVRKITINDLSLDDILNNTDNKIAESMPLAGQQLRKYEEIPDAEKPDILDSWEVMGSIADKFCYLQPIRKAEEWYVVYYGKSNYINQYDNKYVVVTKENAKEFLPATTQNILHKTIQVIVGDRTEQQKVFDSIDNSIKKSIAETTKTMNKLGVHVDLENNFWFKRWKPTLETIKYLKSFTAVTKLAGSVYHATLDVIDGYLKSNLGISESSYAKRQLASIVGFVNTVYDMTGKLLYSFTGKQTEKEKFLKQEGAYAVSSLSYAFRDEQIKDIENYADQVLEHLNVLQNYSEFLKRDLIYNTTYNWARKQGMSEVDAKIKSIQAVNLAFTFTTKTLPRAQIGNPIASLYYQMAGYAIQQMNQTAEWGSEIIKEQPVKKFFNASKYGKGQEYWKDFMSRYPSTGLKYVENIATIILIKSIIMSLIDDDDPEERNKWWDYFLKTCEQFYSFVRSANFPLQIDKIYSYISGSSSNDMKTLIGDIMSPYALSTLSSLLATPEGWNNLAAVKNFQMIRGLLTQDDNIVIYGPKGTPTQVYTRKELLDQLFMGSVSYSSLENNKIWDQYNRKAKEYNKRREMIKAKIRQGHDAFKYQDLWIKYNEEVIKWAEEAESNPNITDIRLKERIKQANSALVINASDVARWEEDWSTSQSEIPALRQNWKLNP